MIELVNEFTPTIPALTSLSFYENVNIGVKMSTLIAEDQDKGLDGDVEYVITGTFMTTTANTPKIKSNVYANVILYM